MAQELVREGYDVIVEPGPQLLPGDLAGYRPDILARRGDETLAVETKLLPDPASARSVDALARAVRSRPNWRFRLVTAPREEVASPWTVEEVARRVDDAERILAEGHPEAALLLLFAAAEALGRRLADGEEVRVQRWNAPALFRELVHHGLLDANDLGLLERARGQRNLTAHGAAGERPLQPDDIVALTGVVRRMLAETAAGRGFPNAPLVS